MGKREERVPKVTTRKKEEENRIVEAEVRCTRREHSERSGGDNGGQSASNIDFFLKPPLLWCRVELAENERKVLSVPPKYAVNDRVDYKPSVKRR